MKNLSRYVVSETVSISKAYKKMLRNKRGIILVCDNNSKIIGLVSDGDFKRAFWSNIDQQNPISSIGKKKNFFFINSKKKLKRINSLPANVNHVPVIKNRELVDIIFDINEIKKIKTKISSFSVVILAGGYGKRLKPITNSIPKALVRIKNRTIFELIINKFKKYKIDKIYLALFHKKEMIKSYVKKKGFKKIKFIEEKKRTGTAGPLANINFKKEKFPVIVTNCDTILNYDYNEILKFHSNNSNLITIVGFLHEQNINYGVCEVTNKGTLKSLIEKPKIKLLANCGFYIISPAIIRHIKKNNFLDMDVFVKRIIKKGYKIGVYPIPEENCIDIGTLEKYQEFNKKENIKKIKIDNHQKKKTI